MVAVTFPARAIVDLDAIRDNTAALAGHAGSAAVLAVVKADGYGHGLVPAARAALAGGATWLGTAQLDEALALRAAGITAPVLSWLYAPGAPFAEAVEADIDLSVGAPWMLAEILSAAHDTGRTARLHLKVDTGLGRNGLMPAELATGCSTTALAAEADGLARGGGALVAPRLGRRPGQRDGPRAGGGVRRGRRVRRVPRRPGSRSATWPTRPRRSPTRPCTSTWCGRASRSTGSPRCRSSATRRITGCAPR